MVLLPQTVVGARRAGTLLGNHAGSNRDAYRVQVSYPLSMGQTELTQGQWATCVAAGACVAKAGWGPGSDLLSAPALPMGSVSWDDAQTYLAWINTVANLLPDANGAPNAYAYRLPTEAEWEYAARAGSDADFSVGPENTTPLSAAVVNYDSERALRYQRWGADGRLTATVSETAPGRLRPVAAGSLPANAWLLHEMHGNLFEWTADCFEADAVRQRSQHGVPWPASRMTPSSAPGATCGARVLRSGSWSSYPEHVSAAFRDSAAPASRYVRSGFRLARTLP